MIVGSSSTMIKYLVLSGDTIDYIVNICGILYILPTPQPFLVLFCPVDSRVAQRECHLWAALHNAEKASDLQQVKRIDKGEFN